MFALAIVVYRRYCVIEDRLAGYGCVFVGGDGRTGDELIVRSVGCAVNLVGFCAGDGLPGERYRM